MAGGRRAVMVRISCVVVLVALALVCGYFLLAGFEYPGVTQWKIFTGGLGVFFLLIAFLLAAKRARP